jgi:hypothetical protein
MTNNIYFARTKGQASYKIHSLNIDDCIYEEKKGKTLIRKDFNMISISNPNASISFGTLYSDIGLSTSSENSIVISDSPTKLSTFINKIVNATYEDDLRKLSESYDKECDNLNSTFIEPIQGF